MYESTTPGTASTQTLTNSTTAVNISITAAATQRVVLEAYDDYGNRSDLHFRADGSIADAAGLSSFVESDSQVDSERTGLAPVAGAGVLLVGREFVTKFSITSVPGAVLPVTIPMTYRSGLTDVGHEFDGACGIGWDFGLDSRIAVSGTSRVWYPGNGRRESGFTSAGSHVWDSPAGIFRKLTYDKTTGEYSLESRDGTTLIYSGSSNLLSAMEDAYGNRIKYARALDVQ